MRRDLQMHMTRDPNVPIVPYKEGTLGQGKYVKVVEFPFVLFSMERMVTIASVRPIKLRR